MSGYQVIIDALRKAGHAAESAGKQAGAVDLAETLTGVAEALPGYVSLGRSLRRE